MQHHQRLWSFYISQNSHINPSILNIYQHTSLLIRLISATTKYDTVWLWDHVILLNKKINSTETNIG